MSEEKNETSRRDFLKKAAPLAGATIFGGAALAGCAGPSGAVGPTGATGATGPTGPAGPQGEKGDKGDRGPAGSAAPAFVLPISVAPSKGVLLVDERMCGECGLCQYACSYKNEQTAAPFLSRIMMLKHSRHIYENCAAPCKQCIDPQCVRYCPTSACHVDEATGTRVINQAICIGCQECVKHCTYSPPRVGYNEETKKCFKCDLCGGDPECVKACPSGALTYFTSEDGVQTGFGAGGFE